MRSGPCGAPDLLSRMIIACLHWPAHLLRGQQGVAERRATMSPVGHALSTQSASRGWRTERRAPAPPSVAGGPAAVRGSCVAGAPPRSRRTRGPPPYRGNSPPRPTRLASETYLPPGSVARPAGVPPTANPRCARRSFGAYFRWVDNALRHRADGCRLLDSPMLGLPSVRQLARRRCRRSAFADVHAARAHLEQADRAGPGHTAVLRGTAHGRHRGSNGPPQRAAPFGSRTGEAVEALTGEILAPAQAKTPQNQHRICVRMFLEGGNGLHIASAAVTDVARLSGGASDRSSSKTARQSATPPALCIAVYRQGPWRLGHCCRAPCRIACVGPHSRHERIRSVMCVLPAGRRTLQDSWQWSPQKIRWQPGRRWYFARNVARRNGARG